MNLLGYCLSAVPVVAGCGYGIYALTRGGQSVSSPVSTVSDLSQNQDTEQVTRGGDSLEDTSSNEADGITGQEENQRVERIAKQQRRTEKSPSSRKSLSDFKWVLGKGERGEKKELLVQIKKVSNAERLGEIGFGTGFTVSADDHNLEAGYFLCIIDSQIKKYFLMRWDSSTSGYVTINGDRISPCGWRNEPKGNVAKYSITKWNESEQKSKPLKDVKQVDLKTCTIDVRGWNNDTKKLKMICKKSSDAMLDGRPDNSDILIELNRTSAKK